jgi:uncharacterized integral membrane protein
MDKRPSETAAQRAADSEAEGEAVWPRLWRLVTRANVALQLLVGACLLLLVDLVLILRIRFGWTLRWPNGQLWPHWLMLALPAIVTLLWLTLAVAASLATYRDWRRQRRS